MPSAAERRRRRRAAAELAASSAAYQAAARPVPRSTPKPPRGGRSPAAQEVVGLGEDLKRKGRALRQQQRRDRDATNQAAAIWAGEQLVQPWEVPPPPKAPKRKPPKTWAEYNRRKREEAAAARRAWEQRPELQRTREMAAQAAIISSDARRFLAGTATPERREQMLRRPVPKQRGKSDWQKFWSGNFIESAEGALAPLRKGVSRQVDLWGDTINSLYEAAFDEEDRAELAALQADALQTGLSGGEIVGNFLGPRSGNYVAGDLQRMGVGEADAQAAGKVIANFIRNVSTGVIGIGPGAVAVATDPVKTGGEITKFYAEFYEPLFRGDFDQFRKNLAENPDMALDWLGAIGVITAPVRRANLAVKAAQRAGMVGTTPARAAGRALVTGKVPRAFPAPGGQLRFDWGREIPVKTLKAREGRFGEVVDTGVQQYVAKGPVARGAGRAWDKLADIVRPTRGGRVRKGIQESVEANRGRVFAEVEGFRKAARGIQKEPMLAKAFDRMLVYGGDAASVAARIRREIEVRQQNGLTESPAQVDEITRLGQAAEVLDNPPPRLIEMVEQGRRLADNTQRLLSEAGVLNPRTAERMLLYPARFLEDVPPVSSPMRDQMADVLRERGFSEDEVAQSLAYLDAQAVSWARRMDIDDPGAFYDEIYQDVVAAEWEDINDYVIDDPDDLLTQYGEGEVPFSISADRSADHRRAHEALTSDDPEIRAAAEARARPKHTARITTIEQKVDRVLNEIPTQTERAEFARWYRDIWPEFEAYFGTDTQRAVHAFLISQAAMSPADGLARLLYLLEVKNDTGRWPKPKFNDAKIIRAWEQANLGEDPGGIAAKIADFYGSAYGEGTRTWLQRLDAAGGPGVVDRWTLRSDGFLDQKTYEQLVAQGVDAPNPNVYAAFNKEAKRLRKKRDSEGLTPEEQVRLEVSEVEVDRLGPPIREFYDMASGPSAYQYEWSSLRLNQMRDEMNARAIDGRTDWSVDEAQALDWFATRREWGQPGGGWDDTWAKSTWHVVGDIAGDMRKEWLSEGKATRIVEVKTAGSTGRTRILGTETEAMRLGKRMADETGRPSYVFYDAGSEKSASRTLGQRKLGVHVSGDSDAVITALKDRMSSFDDDGLLLVPWGDGSFRIMFTDREGASVTRARERRDALVMALTDAPVEVQPLAVIMGVVHGKTRPSRRLYRGDDRRGVFASAAAARRRRSEFRVSEVRSEPQAARFVAGLQSNARNWSLSPRAVSDFTEGGYRGFLTDDGNAGAAIAPDGEIVSVFNSNSFSGAGAHVFVEALANGGFWLNAYDGFLPPYYANAGFREVARLKFTEEFAPPGWTYGEGRPDIVFMAYAPHRPISYGKYVDSFEAGEELARRVGERNLRERGIDSILHELADRGDGVPHQNLAQWKRSVSFTEGDPVIQGAVRLGDDGVTLMITPAANFSTLVHENAHATLRATMEWLRQGEDPRLPALQQHLGIRDVDAPYSVESQELFARLVEAHAYMGYMPAPQLRRMWESTNRRMREIYRGGIKQLSDSPEQAEKIQNLLLDYDVSSLLGDLLDVTYGTTRETNAVFMPRIPPTAPSKVSGIIRRITGSQGRASITPPRRTPVAKGAKGIRFEKGEYRYGPDVVADYATSAFRWQLAEELARDIYRSDFAKTIEVDEFGTPLLLDDHVPFVYRSVPGAIREMDRRIGAADVEADLRAARAGEDQPESIVYDAEPQEAAEQISAAADEVFAQEVLPANLDAFDPFALEELLSSRAIVQIPKKIAKDYKDALSGGVLMSEGAKHIMRDLGILGQIAAAPLGVLNFFARWSMIGKGAYVTNNTLGAGLTATFHNPFWVGEIKKASDHVSSWSPQSLRLVDEMVGAGTFDIAQVLDEAAKADMSTLQRFSRGERQAYIKATEILSIPERRVRRALALRELRSAGYRTEEQFRALVEAARTDGRWRAEFNQIARHSEDGMIRFRGMNQTEQAVVRRAFFVYGWLRASLRYTARFPLEHPVLATLMHAVGNEGWDILQEQLEKEIGFRGGIVTKLSERERERIARMIDITGVLPFGTGVEVVRAISSIPLGYLGEEVGKDWGTIADMFTPGVAFGLASAFGETPEGMTPEDIVKGYGPDEGFAGVPLVAWIARMADPNYTETKTFGKRTRTDLAMSFLLGQLWPRDTKVDSAHESWLRRQQTTVSAPIRAQMDLDFHLERYAQAVRMNGDSEDAEWTTSLQAHAAYDTISRLKDSEWNDLPEKEREFERRKARLTVLKRFYPEAYNTLKVDAASLDAETVGELIDEEYDLWVTEGYSDLRSYIRDTLGEDALKNER